MRNISDRNQKISYESGYWIFCPWGIPYKTGYWFFSLKEFLIKLVTEFFQKYSCTRAAKIQYLISQNKTPSVNNPLPVFYEKSSRQNREKILDFFLFLGGKTQKTCIKKGWVNTPPLFLGRVGLFDRGCFISRDKV